MVMHNKINHKTDLNDDLDQIRLKARETREAISQAAHDVKQRANEAFQQSFKDAKEKSGEMQDSVVAYVKDNPHLGRYDTASLARLTQSCKRCERAGVAGSAACETKPAPDCRARWSLRPSLHRHLAWFLSTNYRLPRFTALHVATSAHYCHPNACRPVTLYRLHDSESEIKPDIQGNPSATAPSQPQGQNPCVN
ncbi:unnamed protein product [Sphagnum balticum]